MEGVLTNRHHRANLRAKENFHLSDFGRHQSTAEAVIEKVLIGEYSPESMENFTRFNLL